MALAWVPCFCSYSLSDTVFVPIGNTGMGLIIESNVGVLKNLANNPNATKINVTKEDQIYNVPIQFNFKYFDKTFNNSWMSENGVVTFQNPGTNSFCCSALPINSLTQPTFNYSIFPAWTDWTTKGGGSMYTQGDSKSQTYGWYNMNEFGTKNKGSFELTLNSDNTYRTVLNNVLVTQHSALSGGVGKASERDQRFQSFYHGVEGVNPPKTQTWTYDILPRPDILISDTKAIKPDGTIVDYIFENDYANKRVGFGYIVGYDLKKTADAEENKIELKNDNKEDKRSERKAFYNLLSRQAEALNDSSRLDIGEQKMNQMTYNNTLLASTYGKVTIVEIPFYQDKGVYRNQRVIDNTRAIRALQSTGTMEQMIESQWDLK